MTLREDDVHIAMKLDTGAQANVMSETEFKKIRPRPKLHESKVKVRGDSGVTKSGKHLVKVTHNDREHLWWTCRSHQVYLPM